MHMHSQPKNSAEWNALFHALDQNGQGVWKINIYPASLLPVVIVTAMAGNRGALRILEYFEAIALMVDTTPADEAPLCLLCHGAIIKDYPGAISMLCPDVPETPTALLQSICRSCYSRHGDGVGESVRAALQPLIGVRFRTIEIHKVAGQA